MAIVIHIALLLRSSRSIRFSSENMAESCPPLSCPFDASTAVETVEFAGGDGSGSERKLIHICPYRDESQIQQIIALVAPQLSEPYSIFTYRFFLSGWPQLCFLAHDGDKLVGAIVSKDEMRKCRDGSERKRGYVAMLVVDPAYRKAKIGLRLAALCMQKMVETCDEVSVCLAVSR